MDTEAQGDLADVVARASGAMAPPPSMTTAADTMAGHEIMLEAPPAMVDPYHLTAAAAAHGGYWLPPHHHHQQQQQLAVEISQHAASCYAHDVVDVDADEAALMRISPPAHQIIKRKNEVKKVVCIPALPPTSSRPGGGEVIPSDLWAWRKYGQKPIKGSPYPRYVLDKHHGKSNRKPWPS